jgi:hypothetical protein
MGVSLMAQQPERPGAVSMRAVMDALADAAAVDDSNAYWNLHSADFVAHIPGKSRVAGQSQGRAEMERLESIEATLMNGTIRHEAHDTLVSADHAVVLMRITASRDEGVLEALVT